MNLQPEDLRSCPFCLGLATLEKIEDRCYGVGCADCDFQLMNGSVGIGWHESEQEAIAAWNKRGGDLAMSQLRAWVKELQDENTALKAAAQAAEPFGYVNTHTGQFFKGVEPCRKTNEGHWRTVFTAPQAQADARDASNEWEEITTMPTCDDLIWLYCQDTHTVDGPVAPHPSYEDSWTHWAYANAPSTAAIAAQAAQQGGDKQ